MNKNQVHQLTRCLCMVQFLEVHIRKGRLENVWNTLH